MVNGVPIKLLTKVRSGKGAGHNFKVVKRPTCSCLSFQIYVYHLYCGSVRFSRVLYFGHGETLSHLTMYMYLAVDDKVTLDLEKSVMMPFSS